MVAEADGSERSCAVDLFIAYPLAGSLSFIPFEQGRLWESSYGFGDGSGSGRGGDSEASDGRKGAPFVLFVVGGGGYEHRRRGFRLLRIWLSGM